MKWHLCDESFPQLYQDVLLTDGERIVIGYLTTQDSWEIGEEENLSRITHWMPLPKLPGVKK